MDLLTIREVANKLRVTEQTVRAWCRTGQLKGKRLQGQRAWRIERRELDLVFGTTEGGQDGGRQRTPTN